MAPQKAIGAAAVIAAVVPVLEELWLKHVLPDWEQGHAGAPVQVTTP